MDELTRRFPKVWCPNCNKVQPMEFATMLRRREMTRRAMSGL